MAYVATPTDQPDWIASGGAYGDPLDALSPSAPGTVLGQKVEISGTASTAVNVLCNDPTAVVQIVMTYFSSNGLAELTSPQSIFVSGVCGGTIILPNVGPIQQLEVISTTLAGPGLLFVATFQCGVQTPKPVGTLVGNILGGIVNVAAGVTDTIKGTYLSAGDATVTIVPTATKWTAVVYGQSAVDDLLTALGDLAGPVPRSTQFNLSPDLANIQITNNDAVARAFVYAICL